MRYRPVKAGVVVDRGVLLKWAPTQTSNIAELRGIVSLLEPFVTWSEIAGLGRQQLTVRFLCPGLHSVETCWKTPCRERVVGLLCQKVVRTSGECGEGEIPCCDVG